MKNRLVPFTLIALTVIVSIACTMLSGPIPTPTGADNEMVGGQIQPLKTEPPEQTAEPLAPPVTLSSTLSSTSTEAAISDSPVEQIDPCSLITAEEAEHMLGEAVSAPQEVSGACAYNNAKDSLYTVSVAAAQDQESEGILQGQAMMLGMTGVPLDQVKLDQLKALAAGKDYLAYFTELENLAQNSLTAKAHILKDTADLEYWVWIEADSRRQGSLVLVRDQTIMNINLIVPDTHPEPDTLGVSQDLAEAVFQRLPQRFTTMKTSTATPTEIAISSHWTPTLVPTAWEQTVIPTLWESPTLVPGYAEQAPYTGDCKKRPTNSICLRYEDGYIWLVYDNAITGWDDAGNWQGNIVRIAHGVIADYYHVLGTSLIMIIMK